MIGDENLLILEQVPITKQVTPYWGYDNSLIIQSQEISYKNKTKVTNSKNCDS